ncbi:flagellar protein FlgN [Anaeromicropila populeti]|uniref:FlgN protein n=1 Tax=Anaeromicropila populeti TaxID=37658 RepID=A0A1I6HX38_9FIRM|nr:flagellar protein FlgN [Anaeromicropila populeti]SFR59021.1 FlgN protein [Anaeromicropila populeti]
MASLIEELIITLEAEDALYAELLPTVEKKTKVIIDNDLEALQTISALEQTIVDQILGLEHKRSGIVQNIGVVLGKKADTLTLKVLVEILQKQPKEQKQLSELHDRLAKSLNRIREVNAQNKILIEQSLEMIEFNMNYLQSARMVPGNNYTRAASTVNVPLNQTGIFDAKQ